MKIQIKNRYTEKVIIEGEAENLKEFLEKNREANLSGANLYGADLRKADLCGANLHGADLCEANLCGANLHGADLSGADLRWADLCEANLCEADLSGTDLCGMKIKITQRNEVLRSVGIVIA